MVPSPYRIEAQLTAVYLPHENGVKPPVESASPKHTVETGRSETQLTFPKEKNVIFVAKKKGGAAMLERKDSELIKVHFGNQNHQAVFESVSREIEVSHWGTISSLLLETVVKITN